MSEANRMSDKKDKVNSWRKLAEDAMSIDGDPNASWLNQMGEALDDACDEVRSLQAKIDVLTVELSDAKMDAQVALGLKERTEVPCLVAVETIPLTSPVFEPENSLDEPSWMRLISRVNELEAKQRQDENYADEQRERAG